MVTKSRYEMYRKLTKSTAIDTFKLGKVYIELMFITHRLDYVNSFALLSDNFAVLDNTATGAIINTNYRTYDKLY